jgi:hypothetical protein
MLLQKKDIRGHLDGQTVGKTEVLGTHFSLMPLGFRFDPRSL